MKWKRGIFQTNLINNCHVAPPPLCCCCCVQSVCNSHWFNHPALYRFDLYNLLPDLVAYQDDYEGKSGGESSQDCLRSYRISQVRLTSLEPLFLWAFFCCSGLISFLNHQCLWAPYLFGKVFVERASPDNLVKGPKESRIYQCAELFEGCEYVFDNFIYF